MSKKKSKSNKRESTLTAMYEVLATNGPFIDIESWDLPEKPLRNIHTNGAFSEPIEVGDVYLMTIYNDNGLWKVAYVINKYESVESGECDFEYDDDCPICQEMKKAVEDSAH